MENEEADSTLRYTAEEIWEYKLDQFHHFQEGLGETLAEAFSFLPQPDVDSILEKVFIVQGGEGSYYYPEIFVKGRAVILIHMDDLNGKKQDAIVTVIHEAGHAFLGHGEEFPTIEATYEREEDECWEQVRKWLPSEYHPCIDRMEGEGGGTKGKGYLAP